MHMNSKRVKLSSNKFKSLSKYSVGEDSSSDDSMGDSSSNDGSISDNTPNDDFLDINGFPDEVIVKIFEKLTQNELGRIARVCRRWNELTRCPVLWQKVDVKFLWNFKSQDDSFEHFINRVPCRPTSVKIKLLEKARLRIYERDDMRSISWKPLDFRKLCVTLQEKCPDLKELSLIEFTVTNFNVDWCTQFLPDLTSLVLYNLKILDYSDFLYTGTSKIKVLDISANYIEYFRKDVFSRLNNLKELYLSNIRIDYRWFCYEISFLNQLEVLHLGKTNIDSIAFGTIGANGQNLKKLYLCSTELIDADIGVDISTFPQLETICLNDCEYITRKGVASLVQSCPSLQNVYVDEYVAESYRRHQRLAEDRQQGIANLNKLGIVKSIECHEHNKCY